MLETESTSAVCSTQNHAFTVSYGQISLQVNFKPYNPWVETSPKSPARSHFLCFSSFFLLFSSTATMQPSRPNRPAHFISLLQLGPACQLHPQRPATLLSTALVSLRNLLHHVNPMSHHFTELAHAVWLAKISPTASPLHPHHVDLELTYAEMHQGWY